MDDIYDDHRAFHLALLAAAASAWDVRARGQRVPHTHELAG
jgi:hypothetical protein